MLKKILIVDDDPDSLFLLRGGLEAGGYEVIQAANGQEAIEKARRENPDLALLDTKLPDMEGFEVCRQIKKMEGLNTKVIIYTGHIDAVDVTSARLAGADDYEVKTQDFAQLLSAVKKLILGREGGREGGKKE